MKRVLLSVLLACAIVSTQAAVYQYDVTFAPEAVGASGSGTGSVFYDDIAHSLQMVANFSGLSGNVTVTHFHGPTPSAGTGTAGVAVGNPSLPGFPTGATSGAYNQTLDLTQTTSFNGTFLGNNGGTAASAEAAFISAVNQGRAYWNIHTSTFGGGEIRGFLTAVPEPSSLVLFGLAAAAMAARRCSKPRTN